MKAYISSRRFHPGHFSHMYANYLMLVDLGLNPSFYINDGFNQMAGDLNKINLFSEFVADKDFKFLIVWFPSIQSLLDMIFVRFFRKDTTIIYFFHEPYDSFRAYLKSGFGILKTIKISLASFFSLLLVALSDKVVLPSNAALKKYNQSYDWLKKSHIRIPLLFGDELINRVNDFTKRPYISYVGTVADDHAFDEFVFFVARAVQENLFTGLQFLIATRSDLPKWAKEKLAEAISSGRLVVQSGRPLSNQEINGYYHSSMVVWNAYRRSMQSGVMPKAFMFGTPVLVSDFNQSEFFVNHENGELISQYNYDIIVLAITRIIENFAHYSECSREAFLKQYFYKTHAQEFLEFITAPKGALYE